MGLSGIFRRLSHSTKLWVTRCERPSLLVIREEVFMRLIIGAVLLALAAGTPVLAVAQGKVYRCGNEYTNRPAKGGDCKLIEDVGVTVIHGTRTYPQAASGRAEAPPAPRQRSNNPAPTSTVASAVPRAVSADPGQKKRDSESRMILETELQRAQSKQVDLVKEYNNGQPDKVGGEARNYQKYLDRVASMKANMERNQADIDSIQRELSRVR